MTPRGRSGSARPARARKHRFASAALIGSLTTGLKTGDNATVRRLARSSVLIDAFTLGVGNPRSKQPMATLTLDRVLTDAGRLPSDEQQILEELLRQRRIEAWRTETATEAKKNAVAFRAGKLKAPTAEAVIARLSAEY